MTRGARARVSGPSAQAPAAPPHTSTCPPATLFSARPRGPRPFRPPLAPDAALGRPSPPTPRAVHHSIIAAPDVATSALSRYRFRPFPPPVSATATRVPSSPCLAPRLCGSVGGARGCGVPRQTDAGVSKSRRAGTPRPPPPARKRRGLSPARAPAPQSFHAPRRGPADCARAPGPAPRSSAPCGRPSRAPHSHAVVAIAASCPPTAPRSPRMRLRPPRPLRRVRAARSFFPPNCMHPRDPSLQARAARSPFPARADPVPVARAVTRSRSSAPAQPRFRIRACTYPAARPPQPASPLAHTHAPPARRRLLYSTHPPPSAIVLPIQAPPPATTPSWDA
ncbi:hypothetical protein K488DRAFT_88742 [Vararia minispora EC-137]|uniref:Uncharacterized protein n=1 Tax=Vararia minispora EC-137 TaxID=1314806 RepID=A0ACB8QCU4_9AGAM|nr:hypothetical protein K488DRAFT_88742 [Vararia minispora EC-137]